MNRSLSTLIALCSFSMIASLAACGSDGAGFPDGGAGGGGPDAVVAGACGPLVGSCTVVTDSVCTEFFAPTTTAIAQQACASTADNVFATGACDRSTSAGGCRVVSPGGAVCLTVWYGPNATLDQAQQACAAQGGTFVEP